MRGKKPLENDGPSNKNSKPSFPQLELTTDVGEAARRYSLALVGKIISYKVINKNTIQMISRRIWFKQQPVVVD